MDNEHVLKRNLLALSSNDPELSARLSTAKSRESILFIQSKTGHTVPAEMINGYLTTMHSRFDPIKEGRRYLESCPDTGYIIFLGLGAGYHIHSFLVDNRISHILIIEKDIEKTKMILEHVDMRPILMDHRVKILIDPTPSDIEAALLSRYLPSITGNLSTVSLQARITANKTFFEDAVTAINEVIGQIADDYTVQSQFGKKWFVNTLANLPKAGLSTQTLKPIYKALITGAGPSLEEQIPDIKTNRKDSFLIATDTSLPSLLIHDIIPDVVISIDCQQVSYHHFLGGFPKEVPLVLDLASPPVLTDLTEKLVFFSSGHPFSQYVTSHWRLFPRIDTSGGNVSHAALSLAGLLGAHEIFLFGIDFSFPEGKSYARGTYVYPYFRSFESRYTPLETQNFSFLLMNKHILKQKTNRGYRYTTKPMISYKARLEKAISGMEAKVIQIRGKGVTLEFSQPSRNENRKLRFMLSQGANKTDLKEFLLSYRDNVKALPVPDKPSGIYWGELSSNDRMLWMTQLPAAATLKEEAPGSKMTASQLLDMTRKWTLSILNRYI